MVNTLSFVEALKFPMGKRAQYFMAPPSRNLDLALNQHLPLKATAVLILLFPYENELHTLLTVRSSHLKKHAGQISFPGGKVEPDDQDIVHTALREANEEVGLDSTSIEILGQLSKLIIPFTAYEVHPIVGYFNGLPTLVADGNEVEKMLIMPLHHLLDINNRKIGDFGSTSGNLVFEAPYFQYHEYRIWGATAMILSELLCTLFPKSEFAKQAQILG